MASIVTIWALLRLRHTRPILGLYDGYARALFSMTMFVHLVVFDASAILWGFLLPEIAWGVAQLLGYVKLKSNMASIAAELGKKQNDMPNHQSIT